jgi:hypothetical protein
MVRDESPQWGQHAITCETCELRGPCRHNRTLARVSWDALPRDPPPPWMAGDPRPCDLCGQNGAWHARGNNNISGCRGYSPVEKP